MPDKEAITRLTVEVTNNDIRMGIRGSRCLCPVALAMHRVTNRICNASEASIEIEGNRKSHWVQTPWSASLFIVDFDDGKPVYPCSFDVALPAHLLAEARP